MRRAASRTLATALVVVIPAVSVGCGGKRRSRLGSVAAVGSVGAVGSSAVGTSAVGSGAYGLGGSGAQLPPPDVTPPEVAIVAPARGSFLTGASVLVEGEARDKDSGLVEVLEPEGAPAIRPPSTAMETVIGRPPAVKRSVIRKLIDRIKRL